MRFLHIYIKILCCVVKRAGATIPRGGKVRDKGQIEHPSVRLLVAQTASLLNFVADEALFWT